MEIKVEDIILLDDKEYCVIKKYNDYYIIISLEKPIDIKIGKYEDGKFVTEIDKKIIKEVLLSN